jgi:hypothetical protein
MILQSKMMSLQKKSNFVLLCSLVEICPVASVLLLERTEADGPALQNIAAIFIF